MLREAEKFLQRLDPHLFKKRQMRTCLFRKLTIVQRRIHEIQAVMTLDKPTHGRAPKECS